MQAVLHAILHVKRNHDVTMDKNDLLTKHELN